MVVHRNVFFLFLLGILFCVFVAGKLWWLMNATSTNGVFAYQGRGNALEQFRKVDYDAWYVLKGDTIRFRREGNPHIEPKTIVPILYHADNPYDARVYTFNSFWGGTVANGGIFLAVLLVLFFHPDVFPRRARLRIGFRRPFLQLTPP